MSEQPEPESAQIDWNRAKALYRNGLSARRIATEIGAKLGTVRQHIRRHRWECTAADKVIARMTPESVRDIAPATVHAAAARWVQRVTRMCDLTLDDMLLRPPETHSTKQMVEVVSALKSLDDVARRSLGLDIQRSQGVSISINCGSISVPYSSEVGPSIDVQSQIVDKPSQP